MKTKRFLLVAGIVLALAFTLSCSSDDGEEVGNSSSSGGMGSISSSSGGGGSSSSGAQSSSSSVVDNSANWVYGTPAEYNGEIYKTIIIGTQTWMQKNLNEDEKHSWAAAMDFDESCNEISCASQIDTPHQGICPDGWHIPSEADWDALITAIGDFAGAKLKTTSGWMDYRGVSGNGTDDYGFSALPNGGLEDGDFNYVELGEWWSSTEEDDDYAYHLRVGSHSEYADLNGYYKNRQHSVRCLKNN